MTNDGVESTRVCAKGPELVNVSNSILTKYCQYWDKNVSSILTNVCEIQRSICFPCSSSGRPCLQSSIMIGLGSATACSLVISY